MIVRLLLVGTLFGGLFGGALGYVALHEIQILDVTLVDARDPTRSDRWTELYVEIDNPGPRQVFPNFVVPANGLKNWYPWEIVEGPLPLAPGQNATYKITQPPYTGIAINEGFRVIAHDIYNPRIRGTTEVARPPIDWPLPAILNPDFEAWVPSMFHYSDLPYGWIHWYELEGDDKYTIWGEDGEVNLKLELDQSRTEGDEWSHVSVRQRIDFPSRIRIDFVEGTRGAFSAGARSQIGVSLDDVHGGTQVMFLFTNHATDADQDDRVNLTFGDYRAHRFLVTNRTIEVDLVALYDELGWRQPAQRTLPRLLPHGPGDVGMGGASVMAGLAQAEIQRPVELKVFLASYPPHEMSELTATFSFVGGPAWDPAPSRFS